MNAFLFSTRLLALVALSVAVPVRDISNSCNQAGQLALTFDQGPSYYTGQLLNTLESFKVKAAFHVTSEYLDNPVMAAYVRKASSDGHLVGIFVKETSLTVDNVIGHLDSIANEIQPLLGYKPSFVRFAMPLPGKEVLDVVRKAGYIATMYNLDPADYQYSHPSDFKPIYMAFRNSLDQIRPPALGAFISVQHDILQTSVEQSDDIVKYILEKGYKIVRLDECIGRDQRNVARDRSGGQERPKGIANNNDTPVNKQSTADVDESSSGRRAVFSLVGFLFVAVVLML